MTEPFMRIHDLHVQFQARHRLFRPSPPPIKAVNGVSFQIDTGKTFGLVGESGSGKSTIARAILDLVSRERGDISIGDRDIAAITQQEARSYRKLVQVVFQDPYSSLNPAHTVREIVGELVTLHRGVGAGRDRDVIVGDLLEKVGLGSHFMGRHPGELSGGQRQRVAIARALSVEPALIICDEATSALDVSIQSQVINLLRDIQAETGIAYLFIAHDLVVVRYISDDIGVLYLGYMMESGPSESIYNGPAHPYTAMLLAAEPIPDLNRQRKRSQIRRLYNTDNEPPSPAYMPRGCPFANRCALVMDVCHDTMPEEIPRADGGTVRCHLHTEGPKLAGHSVIPMLMEAASASTDDL